MTLLDLERAVERAHALGMTTDTPVRFAANTTGVVANTKTSMSETVNFRAGHYAENTVTGQVIEAAEIVFNQTP